MPELVNRLNQKVTVKLQGDKSVVLEPNGKAKISDKDAASYGVGAALEAHKVIVLPDAAGSKSAPKSED